MTAKSIDPSLEYVLLGSNGASAVVDGGEKFWSQPAEQLEKLGRGERATSGYELAQINVARMKGGKDSPLMKDFVAALERENVLVTLSVWRDLASLRHYVYESGHLEVLRRRREWFESLGEASIVLWWVPVGHRPTVEEALARLERLRRAGPGPEAFDFRYPHPAPDARA